MTWLQLRLDARRDDIAALEELLLASGAVAVTLEDNADQPLLEPGVGETPLWNQTRTHRPLPGGHRHAARAAQHTRQHLLQQANAAGGNPGGQGLGAGVDAALPAHAVWAAPVGMSQLAGATRTGRGEPAAGPRPGLRHRHSPDHRAVSGGNWTACHWRARPSWTTVAARASSPWPH